MANRYPLILDTTDGNKIKELPEGDNLYLRTNSITGVQNIDALGTINAADITIGGQRLVAQSILDLTDTPSSFSGQANQLLKVSSDETSIDFVSLSDIGDITAGTITITGGILPDVDGTGSIGSAGEQFNEVRALDLYGNLRGYDGTLIFNASANAIPYAAIAGGPTSLSEFTNDTGYVTQAQVDATLASGITISDFKGSVFGDDSTLLVDAVASRINPAAVYGELGGPISVIEVDTPTLISTNYLTITTEGDLFTQVIDIEPGGVTSEVNITSPNITITGNINNRLTLVAGLNSSANITAPTFTGEFIGSVFADDSTIVFDATDGKLKSPTVSGTATFEENIIIQGNLTVQGTTTSVETTNTTITDNIIVLNQGELGAGVTAGTSGIEIDRGSQPNASFVYDDAIDKWNTNNSDLRVRNLDTSSGSISGFTNITGAIGGTISQFTNITGDSGGTISAFTNITGDSGGTISQFTNITGDSGGTISGFTNLTGDSGGTISQFTNITGDSGGTISAFTNITGDSGGTISAFTNITGDGGGLISQFRIQGNIEASDSSVIIDYTAKTIAGTFTGPLTGTVTGNVTGNLTGNVLGNVTGNVNGDVTGDLRGSVFGDDSTIIIDGTNNTVYGTFVGDIIGDMTGDPVLTLATPGDNPGEIINIAPGGSANFVNLVADTIRFFGNTSAQNDLTVLGTLTTNTFVGTGDLTGSVFGDDSTIIIDGVNNTVNLDGTVRGNIIPDAPLAYDIGSVTNPFRDIYLSGSSINMGGLSITVDSSSGKFSLPIDLANSLNTPYDVGLSGFYGFSPNFSENANPIDPNNSVPVALDPELNQFSGPIFAYSKIVFATPIPGYSAGIEYSYDNFPEITLNGATPPTIVADIDGGGNLLSLEITDPGTATGNGDDLLFYPLGDPGSLNGGQIGLQDNGDPAPIVTASNGTVTVNVVGNITGDLNGSVFADDSTILVDAVNATIPGYISIAALKTVVAASSDFGDFQTRIAAL